MKAIWTFDPFEQNKTLRKVGKNLLSNLFDNSDTITAVYVASPSEIRLTNAFDIPKTDRFSAYPKKIIQDQLKKLSLQNIAPKILKVDSISTTESVKELVTHSFNSKADIIVTSTHAKSAIAKFVLGSFAETLIHFSLTDLLLYNQKSTLNKKPKKIIYANDFSRKGSSSIEKVLKYAKKWNASVEIVHIPKQEFFLKLEGQVEAVEAYRKHTLLLANNIKKRAKRNGIECNIHFESNALISEHESILNFSKKLKADMIVVTAKTGKLAALLGGSTTRKVIRSTSLPVLVMKN